MPDHSMTKKVLACSLILFPLLAILAFVLHFHSVHAFFDFRWQRPPYDAGKLFDALTGGRGHGFMLAHTIVYLSIPFLLVTTILLSWYLFQTDPGLASLGAATGIIGCLAMAGVVSSWLSYTAVSHVSPEYYEGARAALIELTRKQGFFQWNTGCSYLAFIGLILLAAGLWIKRQFPAGYMSCIIAGATLFLFFMDMDNWMILGTILLSIGLFPVIRRLWQGKK